MKKLLTLVLALCLACSLASVALADGLTFTTGGTAGTYFAFGTVLANYISNNTDLQVTAVAGTGSADNIDALDIEDAQLGFVQNDVANYALNGIRFERYEGKPVTSFCALAALYTETVQLVTCNPDIKSVADLKGKNVSIGSSGSGVYFNAMDFLAAYDMTEADIDTMREIVSEDMVFVHMSGMRQTREEYFADVADGSLTYYTIGMADPVIEIDGDHAIITYTSILNANAYGARGTFRMKGSHHYENRDGAWIAVNK